MADSIGDPMQKSFFSISEINSGAINAGRLLLQEASESLCRKLKPDLDNLLSKSTGLRLVNIHLSFFWSSGRESIS